MHVNAFHGKATMWTAEAPTVLDVRHEQDACGDPFVRIMEAGAASGRVHRW